MKKEPAILIANAIIWGSVIVACSLALKGTGMYREIQNILAVGAVVTTVNLLPLFLKKKEQA